MMWARGLPNQVESLGANAEAPSQPYFLVASLAAAPASLAASPAFSA